MTLSALTDWVQAVPEALPKDMIPMADSICEAFQNTAKRLLDLGLGYLTLDRSAGTLSTGDAAGPVGPQPDDGRPLRPR